MTSSGSSISISSDVARCVALVCIGLETVVLFELLPVVVLLLPVLDLESVVTSTAVSTDVFFSW